jgi:hypothetical protein
MDTPVDVGVVMKVKITQRIQDALGLLACGSAVQIDKGPAIDLLVQGWKVIP